MLVGMWHLTVLPKWIYALTGLIIIGFITSSVNWLSGNIVGSVMRQSAYFLNFGPAPLILVPMIYVRMKDSRNYQANLLGLLYFLILPSTLILLAAKLFEPRLTPGRLRCMLNLCLKDMPSINLVRY